MSGFITRLMSVLYNVALTVWNFIAKSVFKSEAITTYNNNELLRIVLLGKTGVGKGASGNTILGQKHFESECSPRSKTTQCGKVFGVVCGQRVAVIDTPGLFDTQNDEEGNIKAIVQCISYACPGPHVFLIIISLSSRCTEEEKQTVEKIQTIFGQDADNYSMVLFTHGDKLKEKTVEQYLMESEDLQELVAKCKGQYHVFNNEVKNQSQVTKLLEKIQKISVKNGGSYYTTEMFQKAEKAIEEKKQQILREKQEELLREKDEERKKIEEMYEEQLKKVKDELSETKLKAARDRDVAQKLKEVGRTQEERARQEAEMSNSIKDAIYRLVETFLSTLMEGLRAVRLRFRSKAPA